MALPVNFKDDVLASSMDGKRRYNMITNSDGTVSFEDVTTYSQEGSNFGSAQINNTNGAINTINNNVLDTIEQISANTSGGKFAGALALKNVNNSIQELLKSSVGNSINMIATVSCGNTTYTPVVRIRILLKQVTVIDATATGSYQTSSSEVIKTYTDTDNNIKIKVRFTAVSGNTVPNYAYISINDGSEQKFNVGIFSYEMSPITKNFAGYIIKVDNKYSTSLAEIN